MAEKLLPKSRVERELADLLDLEAGDSLTHIHQTASGDVRFVIRRN